MGRAGIFMLVGTRTSVVWPRNLREMHFRHSPGAFPDFVGIWR